MTRITTVVSDFGGVLTTSLEGAFSGFVADTGISLVELGTALMVMAAERGENPIFALEVGALAEADFEAELAAQLSEQLGRELRFESFGRVLFSHLHRNEEMFALMHSLRDRGYRMGLCTNNVREWEPLWRTPEIDALFDVVIDSAAVGHRKPDPGIYELLLADLGVPPEEVLFIDDMELNCDAARSHRMRAVQFTANPESIADIEAVLAD